MPLGDLFIYAFGVSLPIAIAVLSIKAPR